MLKLTAVTAAILALTVQSSWAEGAPFIGSWGGGPTDCSEPFLFTTETYKAPNEKPLKIQRLRQKGDEFDFTFAKNYRITIQVRKKHMIWLSQESGDSFELDRCK